MKLLQKKHELLSPAGSFSALEAAIAGGADAVYLGLKNFSARAKARNFSIEELSAAVEYAHLFGVKVYVAANTLVKNSEIAAAAKELGDAVEIGVDAFIVQDLGLAAMIRREYPDMPLHASTQMGIHNRYGAAAAKMMGFDRVILSRETTLEDIKAIKANVDIGIEFFVHGAHCVSFSGNCYYSSLISGYSGNRGKCLQLCRKKYELSCKDTREQAYWLSARDIMMADHLDVLIDAGVNSFKIEGRMRSDEYVYETSAFYKNLLSGLKNDKAAEDRVKLLFNRGDFTSAHLFQPTSNVINPLLQSNAGLSVGKVIKVKDGLAFLNCRVFKGDGIKFLRGGRETGSASINEDGNTTGFSGPVIAGDTVALTRSATLSENIKNKKRRLEISFDIVLAAGNMPCIISKCESIELKTIFPEPVQASKNAPINADDVKNAFSKLNDTEFLLREINIAMESGIFAPKSMLNDMRRMATAALRAEIIKIYNYSKEKSAAKVSETPIGYFANDISPLQVSSGMRILQISSLDQVDASFMERFDYIVLNPADYGMRFKPHERYKKKLILSLPPEARGKDLDMLGNIVESGIFDKYMINNLYGLELTRGREVLLGPGLNQINSAIKSPKVLSFDADSINDKNDFVYVLGRPPLMHFTHCFYKTLGFSCESCPQSDNIYLKDDKDLRLKVIRSKMKHCYSTLTTKNSIVDICDKTGRMGILNTFFDISYFDKHETSSIIAYICGKKPHGFDKIKSNFERGLQ